jgi:hypothetical protein
MVRDTFRRLSSLIALVAWIGGGVAPALDIHADGVGVCVETPGAVSRGDAPTAQVAAVSAPIDDAHCVLCHLQRTVRGSNHDPNRFSHRLAPLGTAVDRAVEVARVESRRGLPSRAPPITL